MQSDSTPLTDAVTHFFYALMRIFAPPHNQADIRDRHRYD